MLVAKIVVLIYINSNGSYKGLGTDYIDLLFLHQPTANWREGYKAIEKAVEAGKVKAIGLSNFPKELLKKAVDTVKIKPQIVQVEAHPYDPQEELKKILKEKEIGLMAWYPLGHGDRQMIEEPVFGRLAEKYGKSNLSRTRRKMPGRFWKIWERISTWWPGFLTRPCRSRGCHFL